MLILQVCLATFHHPSSCKIPPLVLQPHCTRLARSPSSPKPPPPIYLLRSSCKIPPLIPLPFIPPTSESGLLQTPRLRLTIARRPQPPGSQWGLPRGNAPQETSESSETSSDDDYSSPDPDVALPFQQEEDDTLDLSHQLSASLSIPRIPTPPSPTPIALTGRIFGLPPLPPPPPPLNPMASKPTELRLGNPEPFNGSPETAEQWLNTVRFYLS
ncbi:hypothetical protein L210DRAFT_989705, partial [Boletus edulis BED1]